MKTFLILFIVFAMSTVLFAQGAGTNPEALLEVPIMTEDITVTLDGKADEAFWSLAGSDVCKAYAAAIDSTRDRTPEDCELSFKVIVGNDKMMYLFLEVTDDSIDISPENWWQGGIQIKFDPDADSNTGSEELGIVLADYEALEGQKGRVDYVVDTTATGFNVEIAAKLDSLGMGEEVVVDSSFYLNFNFTDFEGGIWQTRLRYSSYAGGWGAAANFVNTAVFVEPGMVSVEVADKPSAFNLLSNYPNPFNPQTTIQYAVNKPSQVTMMIYNQQGQQIKQLVNGYQQAGNYFIPWNAMDQASGIYYCRIIMDNYNQQTRKMLLLK